MTRYGMAVDTARCVGCNTCAMACKVENNVPDLVWWNRAKTEGGDFTYTPEGTYPGDLHMMFYTWSCQHCDNPSCVEVCPTGASVKRDDGIVTVDWETCIGCKSCMTACPYDGVRTYIEPDGPVYTLDFAVGDSSVPAHKPGVVEKCTFCSQRIDRGEKPACVDVCRYTARFFGDLDDPSSEISQILESRDYDQMYVEEGTSPNFYLLK